MHTSGIHFALPFHFHIFLFHILYDHFLRLFLFNYFHLLACTLFLRLCRDLVEIGGKIYRRARLECVREMNRVKPKGGTV